MRLFVVSLLQQLKINGILKLDANRVYLCQFQPDYTKNIVVGQQMLGIHFNNKFVFLVADVF